MKKYFHLRSSNFVASNPIGHYKIIQKLPKLRSSQQFQSTNQDGSFLICLSLFYFFFSFTDCPSFHLFCIWPVKEKKHPENIPSKHTDKHSIRRNTMHTSVRLKYHDKISWNKAIYILHDTSKFLTGTKEGFFHNETKRCLMFYYAKLQAKPLKPTNDNICP